MAFCEKGSHFAQVSLLNFRNEKKKALLDLKDDSSPLVRRRRPSITFIVSHLASWVLKSCYVHLASFIVPEKPLMGSDQLSNYNNNNNNNNNNYYYYYYFLCILCSKHRVDWTFLSTIICFILVLVYLFIYLFCFAWELRI